jgi:soluble lytic murein transglycosylase-like protein
LKTKKKPCPLDLEFKGKGNQYDDLIAGWVAYWNDIFPSKTPLDPNLVKALISTESGFNPNVLANKKNQNSARGLMQLTNDTRKILGDEKEELKEHFVSVTRKELNDPSINICAGVRWLHHKRKLLPSKLKREATWEETINAYKGGSTVTPERAKELLGRVYENLEVLKKCEKK